MKSMTGYGFCELAGDEFSVSVELKSYNNRFLDVYTNIPSSLSSFEPRLRTFVSERCVRGKVELQLRVKDTADSLTVAIDRPLAAAYLASIRSLSEELGLHEQPSLQTLLSLDGVLRTEKRRDPEQYWPTIEKALSAAIADFETARKREGEATERNVLGYLDTLATHLAEVSEYTPQLEDSIKENLRARFREVLGDGIDENRILAETAVLLMKYTIGEEIARLGAHIDAFRAEVASDPAPGKKLDFLCQERNREVNTIGSKSPILEVNAAVVAMKDALENIREQLRNVE